MRPARPADDADLAARDAALGVVKSALERRSGLEEALDRPPFAGLGERERAFARMLAMTMLRRMGVIDARISGRLSKPPPEAVRMLLRLGATQALYLDTPDFAAVDTTVRLAARDRATRPFKGLINGVLRGLLRDARGEDDPETLAPAWLVARWRAAYGEGVARAIAGMIALEPATDLTLRDAADADDLGPALAARQLPGGSLRTALRGDVTSWPGSATGRWWVQDAAAAIPARLLGARADEAALDLCAAPGGKTLQLAAVGARVTAVDRSADRLARLTASLARTRLQAEAVAADALSWSDERRFDAVLLDAPCSATGTFRRHPDVLWATRPGDIASLGALQRRLLDAAADRVGAGGRLVYCVCSLEPEEGEAQARAFLERRPGFTVSPIEAGEGGAPAPSLLPWGVLRILPTHLEGGLDGFFIARFVRS